MRATSASGPIRPYSHLAAIYDEVMSDIPYGEWSAFVEELCLLHDKRPRTALDLACGTGNFSLLLEERGLSVVGVDPSPDMLRVARRKARERGSRVRFVEGGLPGLPELGRFDLATCIFDSINYIPEKAALVESLRAVSRALLPGGVFIFDANTPVGLTTLWGNKTDHRKAGGVHMVWNLTCDLEGRRARLEILFPDGAVEIHEETGYTTGELAGAVEEAGLELLGAYDDRVIRPAGLKSDRVWVVAEKS